MTKSSSAAKKGRTLAEAWAESRARGNNFDAIRLFAASLVIFSHSWDIAEGTRANEPLERLFGQISLGELAVFMFFAVSGFLITKSWQSAPDIHVFARKRALRILPALAAVVILLAFVIGPLASNLPPTEYFADAGAYLFLLNAGFINAPQTLPGLFGDAPAGAAANAPLWTLAFEATCYAAIAALGAARLLKPAACAAVMIGLFAFSAFPSLQGAGEAGNFAFKLAYLGPSFFAGAVAALCAERIPLDGRLAALAAAGLLFAGATNGLAPAFALFGVYLTLWIAFAPLGPLKAAGRFGDFSYGLYLWGWPAQQLVQQWLAPASPLANFALAFPLALLAAALSWRLIEAPMLALKGAGPLAARRAH